MAINPLMVLWFEHLTRLGALVEADSIIELGPQDVLATCRGTLSRVARRLFGVDAEVAIQGIFPGGNEAPPPGAQKALYSLFGLHEYHAIDFYNPAADFDRDLNHPVDLGRTWSVVSNFGTAEHCFNIGACFDTVHRLTAPGGLMLHVLPAMGDLDHGFYNVNPMLYGRLAYANGYEVVDVRYVDHLHLRCLHCEDAPEAGFDFDSLPIGLSELTDRDLLARSTASRFLENMSDEETHSRILPLGMAAASVVYDYCFVALRKRRETPFAIPTQPFAAGPHWAAENFR